MNTYDDLDLNITVNALVYAIRNADGWIVHNLQNHSNSIFPSEFIECDADIRVGQKFLTCIMHQPVTIRKTDGGYVCER